MTEADMQGFFGKHVQKHPPQRPEVYELKICKGTSLPFNSVAEHQTTALWNAAHGHLYHKISDQPWGQNKKFRFTVKKPFDCMVLCGIDAFVVVWFYQPRAPKVFYKIHIAKWMDEIRTSQRKSLTLERARQIGSSIVL